MSSSLVTDILERFSKEELDLSWYAGKRILVTGGAGFIGSFLVEALVRAGAEAYVIDNLWRGTLDNLHKADNGHWIDLEEQFTLGDLRDFGEAADVCKRVKPDLIFHLADIVAGIDYVFGNEPFIFRANILINTNLFTAAAEAAVPKLVYLGTACSYPQKLQEKPGNPPLVEVNPC